MQKQYVSQVQQNSVHKISITMEIEHILYQIYHSDSHIHTIHVKIDPLINLDRVLAMANIKQQI